MALNRPRTARTIGERLLDVLAQQVLPERQTGRLHLRRLELAVLVCVHLVECLSDLRQLSCCRRRKRLLPRCVGFGGSGRWGLRWLGRRELRSEAVE